MPRSIDRRRRERPKTQAHGRIVDEISISDRPVAGAGDTELLDQVGERKAFGRQPIQRSAMFIDEV